MTVDAAQAAVAGSADLIYRSAETGGACWARNHRGHRRELPISRWMGGPEATPQDRLADEHVLRQCSPRPTLDLGCGPGRFTASLQQRGLPALGVDSSAVAVEMTRRRGGTALRRNLFAPLPAEGSWEQILLIDGNIGIGGDPVRTLRRAAELLAHGGTVVVEIESPATTLCHEMLRWETEQHLGHWFPWSRVGASSFGAIAQTAGFVVNDVVDIHDRVMAVLRPVAA
jgi:SAM-dependent methyltransferase